VGCAEAISKYEYYRQQVKDYGVDPCMTSAHMVPTSCFT
jgi:hypothetical protein